MYAEDSANRSTRLGIPSSITLRKASAEIVSQTAGDGFSPSSRHQSGFNRSNHSSGSKSPNSGLLSFKSNLLIASDMRSTASETTTDHENTTTRASSSSRRRIDRERLQSLISFEQPEMRPRSATVGTALTVTDVHVARGTFAVDPKSRNTSVGLGPLSRRLSLVQFRTQTSVHEVIWREDESPCDSSSSQNTSLYNPELLSRAACISKGKYSGSQKKSQAESVKSQGIPRSSYGSSLALNADLFQWSWGEKGPASGARVDNGHQPIESDDPVSHDSPHSDASQSQKQSSIEFEGGNRRRRSVSEHDSVVSFPSHHEYQSAANSQRSTLANSNESSTQGVHRELDLATQGEDSGTFESETAERGQIQSIKKRRSTFYDAPARTAESGRIGSSIGFSSGQRINSQEPG